MGAKDTNFYFSKLLRFGGRQLHLDQPSIMGILNVTPNSFFDGNRHFSLEKALLQAEKMLAEEADIIDIGGYSSRPGADDVSLEEEIKRVIPIIEMIVRKRPETIISIDTFRAEVAEKAVKSGASMVNDISAGEMDGKMIGTVAKLNVPYVLMHMQGTPKTMQQNPVYENVVEEINLFFEKKILQLKSAGIEQIILDPGFGFGKTIEHNFEILRSFDKFQAHGYPILAGLSRKSFIYKTLGVSAAESLNGTMALNTVALMKGADILRVHDVKEAKELVKLVGNVVKNSGF